MLGQHHHTDCEYDPLNPGCCGDDSLDRIFLAYSDAGVVCRNCGHVWPGDEEARIDAMANFLMSESFGFGDEMEARGVVYSHLHRIIEREVEYGG